MWGTLAVGLFARYADEIVDDLDDAQMQRMLACEHGGMNEVAADIHALTGDPRTGRLTLNGFFTCSRPAG